MNAKFYSSHNEMQTNDARCVLKEMADTFHWADYEYILDIGSGPGDVTYNILRPFVAKSSFVVGSDISVELVKFANAHYSSDNLIFKKLDIENEYIWDNWEKESFDKIFSFYCLHWIKNIRQAVFNIHTLLKPGGDILLVMLANNPLYLLFKIMSSLPKWSAYMKDVDQLRSPLERTLNATQGFRNILENVQFTDISVVNKECKFTFPSIDSMIGAIQAVTPYMNNIPINSHSDFLGDLQKCIPKCSNADVKEDGSWEHANCIVYNLSSSLPQSIMFTNIDDNYNNINMRNFSTALSDFTCILLKQLFHPEEGYNAERNYTHHFYLCISSKSYCIGNMNAKFYSSHNEMQTNDARCVLKEMADTFHWTDCEHVLDIGSGPGDVTYNVLRSFVPKSSFVVGSDVSEELVIFANAHYSSNDLIFKKLDIENEYIWGNWEKESFDKIFSFYCLHWLQNLRQAIENIYNLLKPGGDILLVMLAGNPVYLLFKRLSQLPKWFPYMKDVDNLKSPLVTSTDVAQDFRKLLESAQFTDISVVNKECKFTYPSGDSMLRAIAAVTPYINKIPVNLLSDFLGDLRNCIQKSSNTDVKEDGSWEAQYNLIIAKATKIKNNL